MNKIDSSYQEALQSWADMYNKADRERFDLLLENSKLKERIKKMEKLNDR